MSDNATTSLSVSIQELTSVHVAYIEYRPNAEQGNMHDEIGERFRRVQAWVRERGHNPLTRTIGAIQMMDDQLSSYACCVQIPGEVHHGSDGIAIKDLPGGRYAVVSMEKDPEIISESIGRFYREYVPQHGLGLDSQRLTYEIYYESRMEYCVPIH